MIAIGLLIPTKPNLLPIFLPVIHFHLSPLHLCKHLLWAFYHQSISPSGLRRMDTYSNLQLVITHSMTEKTSLSCSLVVPTKGTTITLTRRRCVDSQAGLLRPWNKSQHLRGVGMVLPVEGRYAPQNRRGSRVPRYPDLRGLFLLAPTYAR